MLHELKEYARTHGLEPRAGFKSKYTMIQGLTKTIGWFKRPENLARYKAEIYNV